MRCIVAAEDIAKPTKQSELTGSGDSRNPRQIRRLVMSMWLWVNLSLGALFVLAIVGIPLWMVLNRPDRLPVTATTPAARPAHAPPREATAHVVRKARWPAAPAGPP